MTRPSRPPLCGTRGASGRSALGLTRPPRCPTPPACVHELSPAPTRLPTPKPTTLCVDARALSPASPPPPAAAARRARFPPGGARAGRCPTGHAAVIRGLQRVRAHGSGRWSGVLPQPAQRIPRGTAWRSDAAALDGCLPTHRAGGGAEAALRSSLQPLGNITGGPHYTTATGYNKQSAAPACRCARAHAAEPCPHGVPPRECRRAPARTPRPRPPHPPETPSLPIPTPLRNV
jgi:hypothetical protein